MVGVAELPSGTVTFLFTDLEGSTRLWEVHPDAMHDALARHDTILRGAVVGHEGQSDADAAGYAIAAITRVLSSS